MQQKEIDDAVARATGESVRTIRSLGFILDEEDAGDMSEVSIIDWDDLDAVRRSKKARSSHEAALA